MSDDVTLPPAAWSGDLPRDAELTNGHSWTPNGLRLGRRLVSAALTIVLLYATLTAVRMSVRKYYRFLPDYVRWTLTAPPVGRAGAPTHVFLLLTDHFEPDYDVHRLERWAARYRALAVRHHDHDGRVPQHTFFYPGEQFDPAIFRILHDMAAAHFGEVELHYHHDFDTAETFRPKLQAAIGDFQKYGFLKTVDGRTHFAFVHGNWSLDNSSGPGLCGVNTELRLLREVGCFADFTFPSVYEPAQPPVVNRIYAAKDDDAPKSYARALPLSALTDGSADLMIFEGPLIFAPSLSARRLFLDLDDGNIHGSIPGSPVRVDRWMRAGIHVDARPDWVFVKLFAHGISTPEDEEAVVGRTFDETLTYLEREFNDGERYVLHYITSREAYNLAMAAAGAAGGDPEQYFDSPIPAYLANAGR